MELGQQNLQSQESLSEQPSFQYPDRTETDDRNDTEKRQQALIILQKQQQQSIQNEVVEEKIVDALLKSQIYVCIFSLVFYASFGVSFYFFSTNPVRYNGNYCTKILNWAFVYSLLCFSNIIVRILVQIPLFFRADLLGGYLGKFNNIYRTVEVITSTVLLFGLTILLSDSKSCGDLHSLIFVWVILMWVVIPLGFCFFFSCKSVFMAKSII